MSARLATDPLAAARPRRVLLVQTQAEAAGAQEVSRLLAIALAARGHAVRQVFLFRRTDAFDREPNTTFCAVARPRHPGELLALLACLWREMRAFRPDSVVCFQHFGNLFGAAVARLAGIPSVIANHNGAQDLLSGWVVRLDRWLGWLGIYSRIVVNSEATAREYAAYPDRYRRRILRIDHGFQDKTSRLGRTAARARFGLPPEAVLLGSVARLAPRKHLDAAIRLLAIEPGWHLVLAGQGPARDGLVRLAAALGCQERLHLVGELPPPDVGDLLAALDVFVFPSTTETFGLAAVEAAQAGIPVVSNDLPVMREILAGREGPCALFVDVDDPDAFAGAVRSVLPGSGLGPLLASRGRTLRDRFPLDAMVDGYEALISEAR